MARVHRAEPRRSIVLRGGLARRRKRPHDTMPVTAMTGSGPASDETEGAGVDAELATDRARRMTERGASIGRFLVVDVIGQGAMGVVVRAFDPKLGRTAAVKLVRPFASDAARRAGAHLVAEARALARISHPNVVAVYEVDAHDGVDYVAMELVDGVDLDKWLRQRVRHWREIVQAFAAAADGVSAVHAAGLVHRDIKPANIFVGRDGRVRVGDFGIATTSLEAAAPPQRRADDAAPTSAVDSLATSFTAEGMVAGTPAYMAPEQHAGADLGPAADQYALCVSLFEALYGRRPFDGPVFALAHAKRQPPREPPRGGVPSWLFGVVVRGLSPRVEERFASMAELALALRRDVGRRYRRLALVAAGAIGIAVGALMTGADPPCEGATEELVGVWDDERRTEVERVFASSSRPYAREAWTHASQRIDDYTSSWIAMHTDACTATRVRGDQSEAMLDRRMICLQQRRSALDAVVELLLAGGDDAVDHAFAMIERLRPLAPCEDTAALAQDVPPPEDPQLRDSVAHVRDQLARATAAHDAGRYHDALVLADQASSETKALDYAPVRAEALQVWADQLAVTGRRAEARAAATEALWSAIEIDHHELATAAVASLISIGSDGREFEDAARLIPLAHALGERAGTPRSLVARVANSVTSLLVNSGRIDEARAEMSAALDRVRPDDGDVLVVHKMRVLLANVEYNAGNDEVARAIYEREIGMLGPLLGLDHPLVLELRRTLADLLGELGETTRAAEMADEIAVSLERVHGPDSVDYAAGLLSLGLSRVRLGRPTEAIAFDQRALAIFERIGDAYGQAIALNNLGTLQLRLGAHDVAAQAFERALAQQRAIHSGDHVDLVFPLLGQAELLQLQGRHEQAIAVAAEAERIAGATAGPDSHALLAAKDIHAGALAEHGRFEEAMDLAEDVLAMALRTTDAGVGQVPLAHLRIAMIENLRRRPTAALARLALVDATRGDENDDSSLVAQSEVERATALERLGRHRDALISAKTSERLAEASGLVVTVQRARNLRVRLESDGGPSASRPLQ